MTTLSLQRLEIDTDIDSWINNWRYAVESLNDILILSGSALRNRLSNDRQILELIDSFLDIFSKNWKKNETLSMALNGILQLSRAEEVRAIIVEMYTKILTLFMKLAVFVGKHNYQRNILFDLNRLFHAIVVFKTSNRGAIESIITKVFLAKQLTEKDIETFIGTMEQELTDHNNDIAFSKSNVDKIETFLEKCLVSFEGLTTVAPLLFNHHISQAILCVFLNNVAFFVEHLEEHYCIEQIMYISTDLRGTFGILLTLVDNVLASAYAFFHTAIGSLISMDEAYNVIVNCLQYERFIFYYSIVYPIEEILNRYDEKQKIYINDTLEHIRWNCTAHILEQLKKRGLLVNLGLSVNQEVQKEINYLVELLPHFSPQFIHLCLRHFGYQTEQTANALLNTNELPLDLRALMSVELKEENVPMVVAASLPFYDFTDDEISNEKAKTNATKSSVPLVCMKPLQLYDKQEMESVYTAENVSGSKTVSNVREDLKAEFSVETFLKGRKMDTQIKNKPFLTETFDVPDSEKVALRPTYERYRYLETTSAEYNLYDDEYDDTYDDQCQNYDLDFRDGDIIFGKVGIEPNTNRIPMNDEVNNNVENEKGKEIRGVSARRKKYLKNDRKTMNVVPDERNRNNACPTQLGYTGGRDRQLKERHKGEFRRRQADKKMNSGMF
ncbi:Uncharacterized protein ACO02O_06361 [Dirofilaria immitis]